MRIYDKYPLENTGGYVRRSPRGGWSWKCIDCSTADTGYPDQEEAEEELWEHAEECRDG